MASYTWELGEKCLAMLCDFERRMIGDFRTIPIIVAHVLKFASGVIQCTRRFSSYRVRPSGSDVTNGRGIALEVESLVERSQIIQYRLATEG